MSYVYTALKPHLCKDVIGIIEDMVRWEGDANTNYHDDGNITYGKKEIMFPKVGRVVHNGIVVRSISRDIPTFEIDGRTFKYGEKIQIQACLKLYKPSYACIVKIDDNCFGGFTDVTVHLNKNLQNMYDNDLTDEGKQWFLSLEEI